MLYMRRYGFFFRRHVANSLLALQATAEAKVRRAAFVAVLARAGRGFLFKKDLFDGLQSIRYGGNIGAFPGLGFHQRRIEKMRMVQPGDFGGFIWGRILERIEIIVREKSDVGRPRGPIVEENGSDPKLKLHITCASPFCAVNHHPRPMGMERADSCRNAPSVRGNSYAESAAPIVLNKTKRFSPRFRLQGTSPRGDIDFANKYSNHGLVGYIRQDELDFAFIMLEAHDMHWRVFLRWRIYGEVNHGVGSRRSWRRHQQHG